MRLLEATHDFGRWLIRVTAQFLRVRGLLTVAVIGANALSRITGLLAFFVPLKVMILIGSSGVPHYLRFLIDEAHKSSWIIGLSIGAAGFYALSLSLDAIASRYVRVVSASVLREASPLSLLNQQDDVAREHFARVSNACGSLLFIMLGLGAGLALNFWLFVSLTGLMLFEYLATALLLSREDSGVVRGIGGYITNNLGEYLSILSSLNFLAAFGILVVMFLWLEVGNLTTAILSILLCRQLLQNLRNFIQNGVRLMAQRSRTDPLVFKEHQFLVPEKTVLQRFRRRFGSAERPWRLAQVRDLANLPSTDAIQMDWVDSRAGGIATFEWTVTKPGCKPAPLWLENVFFPSRHAFIEHERFLFRHMAADDLCALPHLFSYSVDEFHCQFYDYRNGARLDRTDWDRFSLRTVGHLLSLKPPERLQESYFGSKAILDANLHEDFVTRLDVAVSGPRDRNQLSELIELLPEMRTHVRGLPLYVYNPDLKPEHAVLLAQTDLRFTHWGRWVLEPVGYGLRLSQLTSDQLSMLVKSVQTRDDCPATFSETDLRLIAALSRLEEHLSKQMFRSALNLVPGILNLARESLNGEQARMTSQQTKAV